MYLSELSTPTSTSRLREDGMLEVACMPGATLDEEAATKDLEIALQLSSPYGRVPVLLLLDGIRHADLPALKIWAQPQLRNRFTALAVVANSKVSSVVGSVLTSIEEFPVPMELFSNDSDAISWLIELHSATRTSFSIRVAAQDGKLCQFLEFVASSTPGAEVTAGPIEFLDNGVAPDVLVIDALRWDIVNTFAEMGVRIIVLGERAAWHDVPVGTSIIPKATNAFVLQAVLRKECGLFTRTSNRHYNRGAARMLARVPVTYLDRPLLRLSTADISATGAFILAEQNREVDFLGRVCIEFPHRTPIVVESRVVRVRPLEESLFSGFAVQFDPGSEDLARQISGAFEP
jgi:hypothetical protein